MQSPPPRHLHRQRQLKKPWPVLLISGIALAVVVASSCGIGWVNLVIHPTPTMPAIIVQGGDQSPDTSSPVDNAIFAPTLGGTTDDFQLQYGLPTDSSGLAYGGVVGGKQILIQLTVDVPSDSVDDESHVIIVVVQIPSDTRGVATWSAATADKIAQAFLPADAQFQRTTTRNGIHTRIYHSDGMAATFIPNPITPNTGAISYECHAWPPSTSANSYGQCRITLGTGADGN